MRGAMNPEPDLRFDQKLILCTIFTVLTCFGVVGTEDAPLKIFLLGSALVQAGLIVMAVMKHVREK